MKKFKQTFDDGNIVFREGEPSDQAFEIVSGNVEIVKQGDGGAMRLALLGKGEMFGEMGILDQGTRSATARAVGPVTVNVISRQDFLAAVTEKPAMALNIMGQLAERLRGTDDMLTHGPATPPGADTRPQHLPRTEAGGPGPARAGEGGFWARLFGWKGMPRPERIQVQVAPLFGEDGDKHARRVVKALEKRRGLRVRGLGKPLKVDADAHPDDRMATVERAARRLLADSGSDLLIWGEVVQPGLTMHLRFVSFATWNDDQPGAFAPGISFILPMEFEPEFADFMYAVSLAATVPKTEAKAAALARDLPLAVDGARMVLDAIPGDLTRRERGTLYLCYANALTRVAVQRGEIGLYQQAAAAYRQVLGILDEHETPFEWAIAQKHLGSVLQTVADRTESEETLGEAADALRAALKVLTKADHPWDWAAAQNRFGEVLYRLDFESGDTEMLKHALGAYQGALQVFTRAEAPMRWAEVMNNFAQVTQILGEQLKNTEALEKAAQACRAALEVRTKSTTPLLWAATQNNLGSALFLLGKMTKNVAHLQGAAEAFDLASSLYEARGMEKMAAITEKNLGHVSQLLARSQPKGLPRTRWEGADPDDPAGGADGDGK